MPRAALLTVADAARRSGLSEAAVRHRATRGTLASVRRGGRLLIPADALPADTDASAGHGVVTIPPVSAGQGDAPCDASVVTELRAHVEFLEAELVARRGEVRELHTLLAQAQARVLPAAAETVGAPTRPAPASSNGSAAPRRWWQRWRE